MKAQVLEKIGPLNACSLIYKDVEIPEPNNHQIRIKVSACGMCLTDRHIIEGDIRTRKLPLIPGHQIVGTIDKLGSDVKNLKIGERVGIFWLHHTCGLCGFCTSHLENLCEKAAFTGYDVDGGYAEYALAEKDYIVHLPDDLSDIKAAPLLCSGIVGYRSYKLLEMKRGERLGIFGFGAAAYLTCQVAEYFGCEVYVFTRSEKHQKIAKELGAVSATSHQKKPSKPLDAAIIFAPAGELVPIALSYLRRGGRLAVNAIHTTPIPSFSYDLIYEERSIKSIANATREDASEFLSLAAKASFKTEVQVYPLSKANQALLDHKASKIAASVVFSP